MKKEREKKIKLVLEEAVDKKEVTKGLHFLKM